MSKGKFLVFDGSYLIHRSYHGRPPYYDYEGNNINAINGVKWSIIKAVRAHKPDYVAVTFDTGGKTFRHDLSDAYKADRPPLPEDLRYQIPHCLEIVKYEGYKVIDKEGFEGDDVIGTLSKLGSDNGMDVIIVSGDKDLAQLVNSKVTIVNCFTDEVLNESSVFSKFGVRPDQMADYLALMGDKVDGIKGVDGIGKKSAANLLTKYDNIDNIIENVDELFFKFASTIKNNLEQLKLDRVLSTIRCDIEFDITWGELKVKE